MGYAMTRARGSEMAMEAGWFGGRGRRVRHRFTPGLVALEDRRLLTPFTVTSTADDGSPGTLRWAIAQANAATSASTIEFDLGTTPATITLAQGPFALSNTAASIAIDGPGADLLSLSGNNGSLVIQIDTGATATLSGLTITGGWTYGHGGGVVNEGSATFIDCTISGNSTDYGSGGGLLNRGTATLTGCTITGNSCSHYGGGGVLNQNTATLTMTGCTISGNSAHGAGVGLNNTGASTLTMTNCTISDNTGPVVSAPSGLNNWGTATLTGCTITGNSGDGVLNRNGAIALTNCTITGNTGSGLHNGLQFDYTSKIDLTACTISGNMGGLVNQEGSATLTDTIVAANLGFTGNPSDISGDKARNVTGSFNLIGTGGSGGIQGGNQGNIVLASLDGLGLAPLGDNGGPTRTMALLSGSPAIAAGKVVTGLTTDQRGQPLNTPNPDIGAYQTPPGQGNPPTSPFVVTSTADDGGTGTLRWAVSWANLAASPSTIQFDLGSSAATIVLTQGELDLSNAASSIAIVGPGANLISVSGNQASRVFQVEPGVTVSISGLTITGGSSSDGSGGAGVSNRGTVTLLDCTISGNLTSGSGSAGGLANYGAATLTNCTITGNSALGGGGLGNWGAATLTNCTITGNSGGGGLGGGIFNYNHDDTTLTLTACTVSGNSAWGVGGLFVQHGTATLTNTIVAGNTQDGGTASDILANDPTSVTGTYNLIGIGGSGGLSDGVDGNIVLTSLGGLGLAALGDNGGPTRTMALLPGSPAIAAGTAVPGLTTDQRGQPLDTPRPDIGAFQSQPGPVGPPTSPFIVTRTADDGGTGTLRWAVAWANLATSPSTIQFDLGSSATTIVLSQGELDLSNAASSITIVGPGTNLLSVSGNQASRVFQVEPGVTVVISGLTITGGSTTDGSGGAGVSNRGTVTLLDCTISGNLTSGSGSAGGLANYGTATLTNCTISGNSADSVGGGLGNWGTATLTNCTITGNTARFPGGGIFNYNHGDTVLTLTACTISGNSARYGGGGLENNHGAPVLTDTIVAGNTDDGGNPSDIDGAVSGSYNLIGPGGPGGLSNGVDGNIVLASLGGLGLAALSDNGGPTQTMALLAGSPAIAAGTAVAGLTTDQRGQPLNTPRPDIGAFQSQLAPGVPPTSPFVVTSTADDGSTGTLRWAVAWANLGTSPSTIQFDLGSTATTIVLTQGALDLSNAVSSITIVGPGANLLSISGNHAGRVFQIDTSVTATISGLTITGGSTSGNGGGLSNAGTTTLTACTISGNTSTSTATGGGGLFNDRTGNLTLDHCTISGNQAAQYGGGLQNEGTMTLVDCTISGNSAGSVGGGLNNTKGSIRLTASTISGNHSDGFSGGLNNYVGTVTLTNCTISGNTAQFDGGVGNWGTAELTACTISDNSATQGGGGLVSFGTESSPSKVTLTSTIVAGNRGTDGKPDDIGNYQTSSITGSYNLVGTGAASIFPDGIDGNIVLTNPGGVGLAPLGDHGGPTQTMPLSLGSRALGAGTALSGITTDQRGMPIASPHPDIGAFQTQPGPVPEPQFIVTSTADDGGAGTLRWAVRWANLAASASTIEFALVSTPATITLSQGQLELSNTVASINIENRTGAGAGTVTVSGNNASRVFQVDRDVSAQISGLTIAGGSTSQNGGGLFSSGTLMLVDCIISGNSAAKGGGLYSLGYGSVTLTNCTISGNSATHAAGGGMYNNAGPATLTHCTISGNTAAQVSGGGLATNFGTLTLTHCTISGNSATPRDGGGLVLYGQSTTTLTGCTISGNTAGRGGGLFNSGSATVRLTNCTISGNTATNSGLGGLFNYGTAVLTNCTVSGNTGAGLESRGTTTLTNTIVAGNVGLDLVTVGTLVSDSSYNLIGVGDGDWGGLQDGVRGNIILTSLDGLGLAPLGDNGGPTQTMALLPGSRAIAAGTTVAGLTTDQRGRPLDSPQPDIGAFQTPPRIVLTFSGLASPSITYGSTTITVSGTLASGSTTAQGQNVAVTLGGHTQQAAIGPGGAFSTVFATTALTASGSPYTITYSYTSDGTFANASTTTSLAVVKATPRVSVTDTGGTYKNAAFPATATVAGVNGSAAASLEGVGPALSYYKGTYTSPAQLAGLTPLGAPPSQAGSYTVLAGFPGSANYATGSALTRFTIAPATPTVQVAASGGPFANTSYPATATVAGVGGSAAAGLEQVTPTLTYYVGSGTSGPNLGSAPPASAGTFTIVARFPGSPNYVAAQSAPVTFTIAQAPSSIALTASGSSAVFGQAVTFVATVTAPGTPAGTVTFFDGSTPLDTVAVDASGQASLTTGGLSPGSHAITASYGGDADRMGATSGPATAAVAPAGTQVVLVPHPVFKKKKVVSVTLTAAVQPMAPGAGVPTGMVTFKVKKKTIGTAALSGGRATLTVKAASVLKKALTIVYSGDGGFQSTTATPPSLTPTALKSLARLLAMVLKRV